MDSKNISELFREKNFEIGPDEVKAYITEGMRSKGLVVEVVSVNVETRSVGYGQMERDEKVFTGATLKFKGTV